MNGASVAWPITWAVETLIASTLLMLAVLLLRRPVRRAFGPDIAYALWALPVLRIALPPLPENWTRATVVPVVQASEQITILFAEPTGETATAAPVSWFATVGPALGILWLVGAAVFIGWHVLAHRRFCRRMLADPSKAEDLPGGVRLIETAAASGPLAFGILRRYVAFPRDFAERYDAEERALALAHELGHHARRDLIANWIALIVLALHWFNPVAWRAFRSFRADQEIANDAFVLVGMNPMRRHSYACAILKAAQPTFLGGTVSATCHLHTIDDLKGRLKMLTTIKTSRARLLSGAGALALLVTGGLGLTASGTAAAAKMRSSVESATGVDLASLDQAVPAPPAPPTESAQAAPPAPAAPPVIVSDDAGGTPGKRKVIRVIPSTAMTEGERAAAQADKTVTKHSMIITMPGDPAQQIEMQEMPAISDGKCSIGKGKPAMLIFDGAAGEKRKMLICTDRIQKAAAEGAAMAANSKDIERNAYVHALDGLRGAKARMLASTDMDVEERKHALAEIDTAIAEIESDLARLK